jgi:hypothetical protein
MQIVPLALNRKSAAGAARNGSARAKRGEAVQVRSVRASDMEAVVRLDSAITRLAKPEYWAEVFAGCQHE